MLRIWFVKEGITGICLIDAVIDFIKGHSHRQAQLFKDGTADYYVVTCRVHVGVNVKSVENG